jgi:hypothetical protein
MPEKPPIDPADHAEDFSRRYCSGRWNTAGAVGKSVAQIAGGISEPVSAFTPKREGVERHHHPRIDQLAIDWARLLGYLYTLARQAAAKQGLRDF